MRPMTHTPPRAALLAVCLGIAALGATGVQAADTQTQNQYQQDVAHCHNTPGINLQACLREAGAAAQAARQNTLTRPSAQAEMRHRTQRCDRLPADQRQHCMRLMNDAGTRTLGSVQSGGMLRETTIPVPPPPAPPATQTMPAAPAPIH